MCDMCDICDKFLDVCMCIVEPYSEVSSVVAKSELSSVLVCVGRDSHVDGEL